MPSVAVDATIATKTHTDLRDPFVGTRIPSLDGLRCVSISLVLLGHAAHTSNPFGGDWFGPFEQFAGLGVHLFFVISGFLISNLLIREFEQRGDISVKAFYYRRALRILPPSYVFLGVVALAAEFKLTSVSVGDLQWAAFYLANYHDGPWILGHLWSLAVEEQFYLIWPIVLAFCGPRRAARVAGGVCLLAPAIRTVEFYFLPSIYRGSSLETVMDTLAAGCLLAFLWKWLQKQATYHRFLASVWFWSVPVLAIVGCRVGTLFTSVWLPIGQTCLNLALAVIVERAVRYPDGRSGRFLNSRLVGLIGQWSYSIYLWQQIFLDRSSSRWINAFPQNVILALVSGLLSFYAVESVFLRLRQRARVRCQIVGHQQVGPSLRAHSCVAPER